VREMLITVLGPITDMTVLSDVRVQVNEEVLLTD